MKRNLLIYALAIGVGFMTACGSDDDPGPPPHIVGDWELDSYILINVPSAYAARNEGAVLLLDDLSFGGVTFESYDLGIAADGTFSRKIEIPGPSLIDNGTWTLDGDDFILDSEASNDDEEFGVERNENDQLWLSQEVNFNLIPDAVLDTLTQEYVDSITNEEFAYS